MTILRQIRRAREIPIVALAFKAGLDDGTFSKCERGFRRFPTKAQEIIAGELGVEKSVLFDESGLAKK